MGSIYKSKNSQGFLSHLSLAVKRRDERVILGPCGILNWTRFQRKSKDEHLRWLHQVREAEANIRFIIRSCHVRRLLSGQKIMEFISSLPVMAEKKVSLGHRKKSPFEKNAQIHPPRESRMASLNMTAGRLQMVNPRRDKKTKNLSATVSLNFVRAIEASPPKGEKPNVD